MRPRPVYPSGGILLHGLPRFDLIFNEIRGFGRNIPPGRMVSGDRNSKTHDRAGILLETGVSFSAGPGTVLLLQLCAAGFSRHSGAGNGKDERSSPVMATVPVHATPECAY
ncbi:MAG: hypothetical protein OXG56_11695 [Gammaproteobacteria bacterium]|nr:hypothetical protein [Gammaproteobacteria bacterium]